MIGLGMRVGDLAEYEADAAHDLLTQLSFDVGYYVTDAASIGIVFAPATLPLPEGLDWETAESSWFTAHFFGVRTTTTFGPPSRFKPYMVLEGGMYSIDFEVDSESVYSETPFGANAGLGFSAMCTAGRPKIAVMGELDLHVAFAEEWALSEGPPMWISGTVGVGWFF